MLPILAQSAGLFGAGVLTSLTPCVYPMIPITLGYLGTNNSKEHKAAHKVKVLGFVSGQIIAFTALGMVAVTLGEVLGFSSEIPEIQLFTGAILLVMAYFSFKGELPSFLSKWNNSKLMTNNVEFKNNKILAYFQALLVGALSALVASPCTGPILGGVLAAMAQVQNLFLGSLLMFSYSLGMSLLFLFLGFGMVNMNKLPRSGNWMRRIHIISSVILVGAGFYYLGKGVELI